METLNVRSWFRSCCLATLAAASVGVTSVGAQTPTQDPEGMPVYRQKKGTFFQNPFSNGYQKLWNKAKGENAAQPQQMQTGEKYSTNAAYAMEEDQIVEIDGVPTATQSSAPSASKKKRWSSQVNQFPGKSIEPLTRSTLETTPKRSAMPMRHTAAKPSAQQMMMRRQQPQPQAQMQQQMVPPQGADRVMHVKDVNEGTPAVGMETMVQPDADLMKTLAPGEEIKSVKERVIGVYRDGKLVPVSSVPTSTTTSSMPMSMPPARHVSATQKEVDPWFGDTVNAPSAEVQELEGNEQTTESLPPQSYMTEPVMPEEGTIYVEQTGYAGAQVQPQVQPPVQTVRVTTPTMPTYAAAPDGEVLPAQAMPAPQQAMRRVAPGTKMKPVSPDVLKKYQTTYRR